MKCFKSAYGQLREDKQILITKWRLSSHNLDNVKGALYMQSMLNVGGRWSSRLVQLPFNIELLEYDIDRV